MRKSKNRQIPRYGEVPPGYKRIERDNRIPVIPLYWLRDDNVVDFRGSGVLITYGNKHFLLTAKHVVTEKSEEGHSLIMGACSPAIPLIGLNFITNPLDFAAAQISREFAFQIASAKLNFLTIDHRISKSKPARLYTMGYSAGANVADNEHESLTARVQGIQLTPCDDLLAHDRARKDIRECFIMGKFERRSMADCSQASRVRDFHGFSGGALFGKLSFPPFQCGRFAGITIESSPPSTSGDFKIIGINTITILRLLSRWFPDLPEPILV